MTIVDCFYKCPKQNITHALRHIKGKSLHLDIKYFQVEMKERVVDCLRRVGLSKFLYGDREVFRSIAANTGEATTADSTGENETLDRYLNVKHHDWSDVLSGGEKQRIGLARLFFHRPRFAVLDESTSAINVDEEGPMYEYAISLKITLFSIAHRLQLKRFHHRLLTIHGDGNGGWDVKDIDRSKEWQKFMKQRSAVDLASMQMGLPSFSNQRRMSLESPILIAKPADDETDVSNKLSK